MFSVVVFGPPTRAVLSTKATGSLTKVASPVVGVFVRACSFIVDTGLSLVIYLVLYLIVVLGHHWTEGGIVEVDVEVELVLVDLLVEEVLELELVEDIEVDVLWLVEVLELVLDVEVVVVKKAAAISFHATLLVQVMGAVSLAPAEELYSTPPVVVLVIKV
jgi:hypothetical protein